MTVSWGIGVDPSTIPPKVEGSLRKELGLTTPIPYAVAAKDMRHLSKSELASQYAKGAGKMFVAGFPGQLAGTNALGSLVDMGMETAMEKRGMLEAEPVCSVHFNMTQPRRAQLYADVGRRMKSVLVYRLQYTITLIKPVGGEVTLDETGPRKFVGHPQTCAKLNAHRDLVTQARNFRKSSWTRPGPLGTITVKSSLKIVPQSRGSLLTIVTLPRTSAFGFGSYVLGAKAFFELVTMLEASL